MCGLGWACLGNALGMPGRGKASASEPPLFQEPDAAGFELVHGSDDPQPGGCPAGLAVDDLLQASHRVTNVRFYAQPDALVARQGGIDTMERWLHLVQKADELLRFSLGRPERSGHGAASLVSEDEHQANVQVVDRVLDAPRFVVRPPRCQPLG